MLLEGKIALVHAAGGQIGRRVAEEFAREGARVWLAGRERTKLEALADGVRRIGGKAEVVVVDALDATSIDRGTAEVALAAGRIDIEFNAIAVGAPSAILCPATEVAPEAFLESFRNTVLSQFLTARAAARQMMSVQRGSIVFLTATPGRGVAPLMAGHSSGHAAVEGLVRSLATEWGSSGIRVTGVMSGGMPETARIREVLATMATFVGVSEEEMTKMTLRKTQLNRMPTLEQTARTVAFLASDYAGSLTGTVVNASCGEVVG